MKYTLVLTRLAPMKALTSEQKLALWWPAADMASAEHDVLLMGAAYRYKYGSLTFAAGA